MKKRWRKSTILGLFCSLIFLFSCKKGIEYEKILPTDAQMVTVINPKNIASKGNLSNLDQYQLFDFLQQSILENSTETQKVWQAYKNNPQDIGIDLNRPFYIFGKEVRNKMYVGLTMKMNNKSDFEDFITQIYQAQTKKTVNFREENGFTFIEGFDKPLIGWNKNSIFILASELGNINQNVKVVYNQIIRQDSSLYDNPSFNDMATNAQDISVWYNNNFVKKFKNSTDSLSQNEYQNNYWVTHISFVNDGISFKHKFHPDPELKKHLDKNPLWKKSTNSELFDFVPAKSYANFYMNIYGERTYKLIHEQKFLDQFLDQMQIDLTQYPNSFEGNMVFSIFDFQHQNLGTQIDTMPTGENMVKVNEISTPQFILLAKMKDQNFMNAFIQQNNTQLISKNKYWQLKTSKQFPVFVSQQNNVLAFTNHEAQMQKFVNQQTENPSFKSSVYAENAKYPLYIYANLDIDQYPLGFQQMIFRNLPNGNPTVWRPLLEQFHYVDIKATDAYTKTGKVFFKNSNRNALENLLIGLDKTYTNIFLQNGN